MARPRKFTEQDVITAARDQFWSGGYAGSSLDDLTEATGLGRGSLYGAFGDKHSLYLRALDDYSGTVLASVADDLEDEGTAAYYRLVRHVVNLANRTSAEAQRGCLLAKSAAELGATDKDVARRVKASMRRYRSSLAATIAEAQRDGDVDAAADADQLALLVLTFLRGIEAMRKSGFTAIQMRAAADLFMGLLPRGAAR